MSKRRRSSYYDHYWPSYEATRPIAVEDGIKAQSQRGAFVKNWWADRWIKALTRLMDSGRLNRGRSYARRGQVLEIDIQPGIVEARVQGSRRTPYKVSIELQPLGQTQWARVLDALAEQALFAAQLLNGEMPPDIERVFEAVHVPLFPSAKGDLKTNCSCPDWANPCKHVAAVYYLLGERFDQDPFLIFRLRGRDKEQVLAGLRERRSHAAPAVGEEAEGYGPDADQQPAGQPEEPAEPLDAALDRFWSLGAELDGFQAPVARPAVAATLLKRLGRAPFERKSGEVGSVLAQAYEAASDGAEALVLGDAGPEA